MNTPLKVGFVGKRGEGALQCFRVMPETEVAAFCTRHEETVRPIADRYDIPQAYTRYEDLLASDVDIIFVGSPLPDHVPHTVAALQAGKHVLCEIPAATTIEECWELLEAVKKSDRTYMLAENYVYMREHVLVRELVRKGFFGEIHYSEGEYVHDMTHHLYDADGNPSWHNVWLASRKGTTYATHALGPVLDWFGERVATVSCFGSGRRSLPEFVNDDSNLLICQTPSGRLIKIRNDVLTTGPVRKFYSLQGTKGVYEGNRRTIWAVDGNVKHKNHGEGEGVVDEFHQVWFADVHGEPPRFHPLMDFEQHLPEPMLDPPPEGIHVGHAGGDYWQVRAFLDAIINDETPPLDIYTGLEITAPGICGGISMEKGGAPVDVPNFRES
jgi:predicted dehydrogenase